MRVIQSEKNIREQLTHLLLGDQVHLRFEEAIKDFSEKDINIKPPRVSYSFWHLLEHIRITQRDILDYVIHKNYKVLEWPKEYWPSPNKNTELQGWKNTIEQLISDRDKLVGIVKNDDLFVVIPNSPGHTLFGEAVVVGNHNSYHLGEFGILRQVVDNWKK